ncbi:MAG: fasciclin domain-containing protein [Bacteroidia bacterium]|nr:fasciclin domain-containing protein [Bacteroidia bacterium]MDW8347308.1 fasciclin domain-containing protein [Bacteroidia bacterium]
MLVFACRESAEKKARQKKIDDSLKQIRLQDSLKKVQENEIKNFNTPTPLNIAIQKKLKTGVYFLRLLHKVPELEKKLTQNEPHTLFIPTDSAFTDSFQSKKIDSTNTTQIQKILKNHVVPAHLSLMDLMNSNEVIPLSQKKIPVQIKNKRIYLQNAQVLHSDIPYLFGIIHSIDQVLY